ncbi:MAG: potassium channel family protein [Nitrospirae bacterium]|nr:potassium channel family protein [Nitrospirota bacterium]
MHNAGKRITALFGYLSGFWSEERNLTVLLGIVTFDFFVVPSLMSIIGERLVINLLNNLVFSFLLLAGVVALTRHKVIQIVVGAMVALVITVRWGRLVFGGGDWLGVWDIFLSLVSSVAFVVVVLAHVYKEGPMTSHRIQGAVAAYLLLAMSFALAYFLIEVMLPGSFRFPNGVMILDDQSWKVFYYFSICTLTTLGYGDITPMGPLARNLTMAEALIGQLYPAVLLARLVSLHTQTRRSKKDE